jgi:ABC-type transport system involved in multi-copper enzyme maturation permease subunit
MWTIFKKEWRENVLSVAVAFIIVLLVLDYTANVFYNWSFLGISSSLLKKSAFQYYYYDLGTSSTLTAPWAVMCILAAILLGLRQIYTERLRRTWSLLVYLPMRREKIIYAKFIAGLTLLVALFLPAGLLIVFRLSTPGVWPGPVYLREFLPLLLHLLAGLACYQIILLAALAPLRWLGTRLLIPFAAVSMVWMADRFQSNNGRMDLECWVFSGISLLVAMMGLWALRSVANNREY